MLHSYVYFITEDIFLNARYFLEMDSINTTRRHVFLCTFAITLREPMTRMENEIVRQIEISLFYLHPCLERTADFNADFS